MYYVELILLHVKHVKKGIFSFHYFIHTQNCPDLLLFITYSTALNFELSTLHIVSDHHIYQYWEVKLIIYVVKSYLSMMTL